MLYIYSFFHYFYLERLSLILPTVTKRANLLEILLLVVVIVASLAWLQVRPESMENIPGNSGQTAEPPVATSQTTSPPAFDKTAFSTTQPDSIWVVVNKQHKLPDGYVPPDLVTPSVKLRLSAGSEDMKVRSEMATAMEAMFADASQAGQALLLASGYRSEASQKSLYNGYVSKDGQVAADRYSARPGYSEHQTGLAFDVGAASRKCEIEECFGDLPEGQWVAAHAHEYGFIVRYGKDQEPLTGYQYEPWHLRYVGKALAAELSAKHQTLEQFFGLPPALAY